MPARARAAKKREPCTVEAANAVAGAGNGSLARLKLPTRLQAQAPRSHSKVKVEERAAQKPAEVLKFACQAGWLGFRPFRPFGGFQGVKRQA